MTRPRVEGRLTTARALLVRVLYWTAVLAVSLVLVFMVVRFFEPRDDPELDRFATAATASSGMR